ncbi:MAG: hypothetical protein HUU32_09500 [Calditrichaceae bacterium]|nr:hypothetical protein [Calditrichia bacterium]NUQ41614.1 hypothetical protein [Calditrichaceae bacterium]
MSSLKKPAMNPEPRPLQVLKNPVVPFSELWQTMRDLVARSSEKHKEIEKERDQVVIRFSEKIDDLRRVVSVERKDTAENSNAQLLQRLESLIEGFYEIMRSFNYSIEIYDGRSWSEIPEEQAELEGFAESKELPESIVAETLIPAVRYGEKYIRRAKVYVRGPVKNS